jgi:hypothetical protein
MLRESRRGFLSGPATRILHAGAMKAQKTAYFFNILLRSIMLMRNLGYEKQEISIEKPSEEHLLKEQR